MSDKKHSLAESTLPAHESGVRRLVADAHGSEYHSLDSLDSLAQARAFSDAVVVFEGDYGGQIYVIAPIETVQCEESSLNNLLAELDAMEWANPDGASVFYERRAKGDGVAGGVVRSTVWVHERLQRHYAAVVSVLAGKRNTIHQ